MRGKESSLKVKTPAVSFSFCKFVFAYRSLPRCFSSGCRNPLRSDATYGARQRESSHFFPPSFQNGWGLGVSSSEQRGGEVLLVFLRGGLGQSASISFPSPYLRLVLSLSAIFQSGQMAYSCGLNHLQPYTSVYGSMCISHMLKNWTVVISSSWLINQLLSCICTQKYIISVA